MEGTKLIISAGMPRSGSTLLFNVLREVLDVKYPGLLVYGWEGDDPQVTEKNQVLLIKTHWLTQYMGKTDLIFYSFRDVRTSAISGKRMGWAEITMDVVDGYIEEYKIARNCGAFMFQCEEFGRNVECLIEQIAGIFEVKVDTGRIHQNIYDLQNEEIPVRYSKKSLYWKNHFTGTSDDEWRTAIPGELLEEINTKYGWWFKRHNYPME